MVATFAIMVNEDCWNGSMAYQQGIQAMVGVTFDAIFSLVFKIAML